MNGTKHSKRVLVVDDEPENLKALRRELTHWLSKRGVSVDFCESGEAALELMSKSRYAVLLADNRMPGMSGTQLVKEVGRRYPTTVSMILTGHTEKHDIEGALSAGIFSFMMKPWDRDDLRREIDKAIQVHYRRDRHLDSSRRMSQELQLAVEFQSRLFALKLPHVKSGIEPSCVQLAAGKLGVLGDYLDIISLDPYRYLVLLGDVSGHGLRTTFVSAMLKTVLTPEYLAGLSGGQISPVALLSWLNHRVIEFTETIPDLFIAFSAFLVDNERGVITASSAGNPLPLLQRGNLIQPVEIYGVALGVNSEPVYEEAQVTLQPGEALFLFTDGIQLPRHGRHSADKDTLYEAILQSRHQEPVDRVIERLRSKNGKEDLGDDITMVRLRAR